MRLLTEGSRLLRISWLLERGRTGAVLTTPRAFIYGPKGMTVEQISSVSTIVYLPA
jgi:hypothetical protein